MKISLGPLARHLAELNALGAFPTTYQYILNKTTFVPQCAQNRGPLLFRMLSRIQALDNEAGRPTRTAVVGHEGGDRMPGNALFWAYGIRGHKARMQFYEEILDAAAEYYFGEARVGYVGCDINVDIDIDVELDVLM